MWGLTQVLYKSSQGSDQLSHLSSPAPVKGFNQEGDAVLMGRARVASGGSGREDRTRNMLTAYQKSIPQTASGYRNKPLALPLTVSISCRT